MALGGACAEARIERHAEREQGGRAGALLVERLLPIELPQVLVADSELALAKIATGMQRDRGTEVFAITGSNGKTSVKTLTEAVLAQAGKTYATPGNRNNEIGLPLSVLSAPATGSYFSWRAMPATLKWPQSALWV